MARKLAQLHRLKKDEDGATVIEFALIAPVFLFMLMGTFDIGYAIYMRSVLNGAVQLAARESSLQDASIATNRAAIDLKVEEVLQSINRDAVVKIDRKNYASYNDVKRKETYTDTNANGTCDNSEPFADVNSTGKWDNIGKTGIGGARDSILYSITVTYDTLFPFGSYTRNPKDPTAGFTLMALDNERIMVGQTLLKNQPYGNQDARTGPSLNCILGVTI